MISCFFVYLLLIAYFCSVIMNLQRVTFSIETHWIEGYNEKANSIGGKHMIMEKYLPELEQVAKIKDRLKECKDEWLETKPGGRNKPGGKYMGVNTVRQILDNAVSGFTYWDFHVIEQWREDVYKNEKEAPTVWNFDGYVYHVKATLMIPGLGSRTQFGCKVAVGGRDNQDSAYKSATSNALAKCASLFGVGESIYSKIKVESEEEAQVYEQIQQSPEYSVGHQPQQQQQWDQQQQWNQQQHYYQDPIQAQQQQQQWDPNQQQQWNPNQQQQWVPNQQAQWTAEPAQQQQGGFNPNDDNSYPFNPNEPGTVAHQQWNQNNLPQQHAATEQPFQATEQSFQAVENPGAKPVDFTPEPVAFGAPVTPPAVPAPQPVKQPEQSNIPQNWPQEEVGKTHQHKARLGIKTDAEMLPYIREFMKSETATMDDLTPDKLAAFNTHLEGYVA